MASVTIITDLFRASHVHLKTRKAFTEKDTPAFRVAALFPQSGLAEIPALGVSFNSSPNNIMAAIKEVVMSEWNFEYDFDNEKQNKQMGIEYGPYVKDGNEVLKRDANGNPMIGEICPISGGNHIFNMKNENDIACASGVDLKPIDVSAPYSGCWGRMQLEVSAFTIKGNTPSRIVSVKALNFLMCYDDESFGGQGPVQTAAQAFAGLQVTDSNLSVATGNSEFRPEPQNKPAPVKPSVPVKKAPPAKPSLPNTPLTGTVTMNADSDYTYQELIDNDFTDQDIIDGGYATLAKTTAPIKKTPPAKKLPPKPSKSIPTTGTVIMNADSEYTYAELSVDNGWTDEDIVNGGYAVPNFTNPQ